MLTRIASFTPKMSATAILIGVDRLTLSIAHADLATHDTAAKIEAELERQATLSAVQPPSIFIHINRDGTVAIATSQAPKVWPEDERAEFEETF